MIDRIAPWLLAAAMWAILFGFLRIVHLGPVAAAAAALILMGGGWRLISLEKRLKADRRAG